jgi:hypothetical protein
VARTIVYSDGFNLYYRALKGTPHKWLDIAAMSRAALPDTCEVEQINYYTVHISGRTDQTSPRRQHAYLRAIGTLSDVIIYRRNFLGYTEMGGPGSTARLSAAHGPSRRGPAGSRFRLENGRKRIRCQSQRSSSTRCARGNVRRRGCVDQRHRPRGTDSYRYPAGWFTTHQEADRIGVISPFPWPEQPLSKAQ